MTSGPATRTRRAARLPRSDRLRPAWGAASEASGVEVLASEPVAAVPAGLLRDDEVIILMLRPSFLYIALSCLTSLAFIGLVTFFLAYLARWQTWIPWTDAQAFALGILAVLARLAWQSLDWYCRVYILTDQRIIRRMGVLRVAVFQTRLRNIQHIGVFSQLRERIFGLGTIGFATSGSDTFDAFWVMIRRPFAVHKTVVEAMERYGRGHG